MKSRILSRDDWTPYFRQLSRRYEGGLVSIDITLPGQAQRSLAHDEPLLGIMVATEAGSVETIHIVVGSVSSGEIVHHVPAPVSVHVGQVTDGADELMIINAAGETTVLDFRNAVVHPQFRGFGEVVSKCN